jgi:hypothetical protein
VYYDDFLASDAARIEYWDFKQETWAIYQHARPNPVHLAIVDLESAGKISAVVTQNVDGLHRRAGTSLDVHVELHGPGLVVECRAIGVLQVEQNRTRDDRSQRIRNDRVMAIPVEARRERDVRDLGAFSERVRQELEHFALAAIALEGKDLQILGWGDAATALELVRASAKK